MQYIFSLLKLRDGDAVITRSAYKTVHHNYEKSIPARIYLLTVNNRSTRTRCETGVVGVVLVSLLLTFNIFHTLLYCFFI